MWSQSVRQPWLSRRDPCWRPELLYCPTHSSITWVLFTVHANVLHLWLPARLFITLPNVCDASTLFMKLRAKRPTVLQEFTVCSFTLLLFTPPLWHFPFHHNDNTNTAECDMKKTKTPSEPLKDRQERGQCLQCTSLFCSPALQFHPLPAAPHPHSHPLVLTNISYLFSQSSAVCSHLILTIPYFRLCLCHGPGSLFRILFSVFHIHVL